jgi:plastocyanin
MALRKVSVFVGAALVAGMVAAISSGSPVSAGGGGCHERTATEGTGNVVTIGENGCFNPVVLRVDAGAEVVFENAQGGVHNVAGLDWGTWGKGADAELMLGETFTNTFTEAGFYPYSCTLHYNMVGLVIVGDPESPEAMSAKSAPAAATAEPETVATESSGLDGNGGVSTWAILTGAGVVALGLVGGGALLRSRRR